MMLSRTSGQSSFSCVRNSGSRCSIVLKQQLMVIIIMEAFIKRRIPGRTTCSKAIQYNGDDTLAHNYIIQYNTINF